MSSIKERWDSAWDAAIHETEYAKKRITSAKSSKLTPVNIDSSNMMGVFQGSHGIYETSLVNCPCGDFRRSKLPCKHIYRLAMELGALASQYSSNAASIPSVRSKQISLSDTVDQIETLSEQSQILLLKIAANTTSESPCYCLEPSSASKEIISTGLVKKDTSHRFFKWGNISNLKKQLKELGIEYDKSMKAAELRAYCADNYGDAMADLYPEMQSIFINPDYSRRNIHYYLHRRYDSDIYIDESGDLCEVRLLDTILPDDKITDELIRRGYYKA